MKLRAFEIRWAATIGRAMLPPGLLGGVVDDVDIGEAFRREYLEPPWYAALLLRFSLWLTWFAPPFVLEKLLDSPVYVVRATATFLKLAACMQLMGHERVMRRIGAYEHGRTAAPISISKTGKTSGGAA